MAKDSDKDKKRPSSGGGLWGVISDCFDSSSSGSDSGGSCDGGGGGCD